MELAMGLARKVDGGRTAAHLHRAAAVVRLRKFVRNRSGATIIPLALAMPVLVGMFGLAAEASYWYLHQRAMQNAADAAVIAAATNAGSNYAAEAKAVAAQYGFPVKGNISVTVTNPSTAAGCTTKCYSVAIADAVPLLFSSVVGYKGNVTINKKGMTSITASSVATSAGAYSYCILALASSGTEGITSNGAPKADLANCTVMSNSTATCHGHNLNASFGDAYSTNNGCGITQHSNMPAVSDPYSHLASNIPSNSCKSYPLEPAKKKDPPLPASNQWTGSYSWSGYKIACGDQQLTGNTTINGSTGAVLVIENGVLDLNGHTLLGSNLTVVFTGSNSSSYNHIPTGSGTLDITAPTTGTWSGVAIYQDPNLTTNVNISYAGNSPTWNITGLIYLPHSSVTFSGAVGKSSQGALCFAMVVDNITINGTGSIFANDTQCAAAGLNLPMGGNRGTLVH
jgi:Flp pilus assembly protein TadG